LEFFPQVPKGETLLSKRERERKTEGFGRSESPTVAKPWCVCVGGYLLEDRLRWSAR
jgi:hypothetical protein